MSRERINVDNLQQFISEITLGKKSLQDLLSSVEQDTIKGLEIASLTLQNQQEKIATFEEWFVRKDLLNSGALKKVTNSYKFFFFKALVKMTREEINLSKTRNSVSNYEFMFRDIVVNMLAMSFYMIKIHNLHLGAQDKMEEHIDTIAKEFPEIIEDSKNMQNADLSTLISKFKTADSLNKIVREMQKNVPWAFLGPFAEKVAGHKFTDNGGNIIKDKIKDYASKHYESLPYKYKEVKLAQIGQKKSSSKKELVICMSQRYVKFFDSYYDVILGFINSELVKYLEKRNPLIPNISSRLEVQNKRDSLTKQTKFWKEFAKDGNKIYDIFDREEVKFQEGELALDHFIPWSFVHDDKNWNLSPIKQTNNSKKSDKLLTDERYVEFYVTQQWAFYSFLRKTDSKVAGEDYLPILHTLNIDENDFKIRLTQTIEANQAAAIASGWTRIN